MFTDLYHRLRALFRRGDVERELSDELQFHLEKETERLIHDGLSPDEAHRQARIMLGGLEQVKEDTRDSRGIGLVEHLSRDLAHAARLARKQWGFTLGVAASLALGLGAATAVFNLTFNLLLADLPIPHPEELVALNRLDNAGLDQRFTWREYQALRGTRAGRFAASRWTSAVSVTAGDRHDITSVLFVDGDYFAMAGVTALRGRLINAVDDAQRERVVVLTAAYARKIFGSDTTAVGQTITLREQSFAVIGVLPRSFRGLDYPGTLSAVIPMGAASYLAGARDTYGEPILASVDAAPTTRIVQMVGRLSTSAPAARSILTEEFGRCCRASGGDRLDVVDSRHGIPGGKADFRNVARIICALLLGGVALILIVVCCNIASLLLVRASARQREIAVRLALGGSRARLIGQLIAENAPAALLGGLGALAAASATTSLIVRGLPLAITQQFDAASLLAFRPGPVTLGFAALLTLVCVVGFSLAPALRATGQPLAQGLRQDGRASRTRGQGSVANGVVVAQVAFTVVLITAASLFAMTAANLSRVDGGFAVDHLLLLRLEGRSTRYEQTGLAPVMPDILRRVRMLPGAASVASSTRIPLYGGTQYDVDVRVPGYIETTPTPVLDMHSIQFNLGPVAAYVAADPEYFAATGIRLISGRDFADADRAGAEPVVIVSAAFQRHYFQNREALGQTFGIRVGRDTGFTNVRVVGVARDAKYGTLRETPQPFLYVPLAQASGTITRTGMVIRTTGDPMRLTQAVTQAIQAAAPGLNAIGADNMETVRNDAVSWERVAAQLAAFIGSMALLLSGVGLYGLVAYSVSRRTSEIGIRLALGAPRQAVLWLIGRETAMLVGIGLAIGIPMALAGGLAIRSQLYGVGAFNALSLVTATALLGTAGLVASIVPARRAARIDPKVALSAE